MNNRIYLLSQVYERYVKCKQPRSGFELGKQSLLSTMMTVFFT